MQHTFEHWTKNTPPRDEDRVRCSVCGFAGVDVDKQKFSETTQTSYTTTGTTYDAHDVADIDLEVSITVGSGCCPFCGTSRVLDGRRGDL